MKNVYVNPLSIALVITAAVVLASCSSNLTYNEAMQRNVSKIEDSEKLEDARFLMDASSYNQLATKMAEAAIESGYSNSLVSMARTNLEEHEDMAREISRLARREKIVLPGELKSEHERILAELTATDRREFDRTYIRLLREVAQEDAQKFSTMATAAESEDVRAFAARKLDMFKSHEDGLQTVDAELLQTY